MTERDLRALKGKQTALKTQLTSIEAEVNQLQGVKLSTIRYERLSSRLEKYQTDLDSYNGIIMGKLTEESEFTLQSQEYQDIDAYLAKIANLVIDHMPEARSTTSANSDVKIKLPPKQLPNFDGSLENWSSFKNLFLAGIQNQTGMTDTQRLLYLQLSMKGDATKVIGQLELNDSNYNEAWKLLKLRFENKREIINSHLKRLLTQPTMKDESFVMLRKLVDTSRESIQALQVMSVPVDHWDNILVYVLSEKLDQESRRQWVLSLLDTEPPTFAQFLQFLDSRARALAEAGTTNNKQNFVSKPKFVSSTPEKKSANAHHGAVALKCDLCEGSHLTYKCQTFLAMSINDRIQHVKKQGACFNCLRKGHRTTNCPSETLCRKCGKNHHTFLHREDIAQKPAEDIPVTSMTSSTKTRKSVLLATAIVNLTDNQGNKIPFRALLDSGSEVNFISTVCVRKLGLEIQKASTSINGVGGVNCGESDGEVSVQLTSRMRKDYQVTFEALTINKVSGNIPSQSFDKSKMPHLSSLKLADPHFDQPGTIDLLIGAEHFWDLLTSRKQLGPPGTPPARETVFGWIVSGVAKHHKANIVHSHLASPNLTDSLQKFWELEEIPEKVHYTPEEVACEKHYEETHSRNEVGRYVTRLPLKNPESSLGISRTLAVHRLTQMEKRMAANSRLKEEYIKFMREYEVLQHMTKLPLTQPLHSSSYFLPHHAVLKESSTTTKLRVVFDASAKSSTGVSLNDCLMVGPKLQDDIFQLLLRWRLHAVAIVADAAKMYRQVLIHPADRHLQMVVWRENPDDPISNYVLNTVTQGTSSASYLATKTIQKLADDEKSSFPLASTVAKRDVYMDDLMSGSHSVSATMTLVNELIGMFRCGGFELRKWASNEPAVLKHLTCVNCDDPLLIDSSESLKTLGLQWTPSTDLFTFKVNVPSTRNKNTKRTLLSDISKIYDPLGWLSPMIIRAKLFFQDLWREELTWDDELPSLLNEQWCEFRDELSQIEQLKIPRFASLPNISKYELLGFCDASEKAYSAVIYLKTISKADNCMIRLLAAKSRVAPVKVVSLPRLELCGAVLLIRLFAAVKRTLVQPIAKMSAWTDSTIVLAWINTHPSKLKTFVANRIAEIQELLPRSHWNHVKSEENPADVSSRGISPNELLGDVLWWDGPAWLQLSEISSGSNPQSSDEPLLEQRMSKLNAMTVTLIDYPFELFSTLRALNRFTAYCLRLIKKCKKMTYETGPLLPRELEESLTRLVKLQQQKSFSSEITCLQTNKELPRKSVLLSLNPFLDDNGILRVGGRLRNANLSYDQKHPMLLPHHSKFTELVIGDAHIRNFQAGNQLLLSTLQRKFWILRARDVVRHFIRRCVTCFRLKADSAKQMMADLPAPRVNACRPFCHTGVDYAGPLLLRSGLRRKSTTTKAYVCIFVCLVTRAVHIELVTDMTTTKFIEALLRFISRRSLCTDIYSDNGSNFVGANRELRQFYKFVRESKTQHSITSQVQVSWHFNPPSSPHFGGLWEAGVKSLKYHLKRVVNTSLTYEEMSTVLTQIEAVLNSRPLTQLSSDPNDLSALTPGHFLVGAPLNTISEPCYEEIKINRLDRYQQHQKMVQVFWRRWKNEYLNRLQQRPKWVSSRSNLKIGDLVIIKDERVPVQHWKLARVASLHPGEDGLVRVVTVKTAEGEYKRPVVKLCLLPIPDNEVKE